MDETERRLRSAMMAAAEPAPRGLLASIYRRHRRRSRRRLAGSLAAGAMLVVAIPVIGHVLLEGPPASTPRPSGTVGPSQSSAARGTVLLSCYGANWGQLESNWRAGSLKVGPLWFVSGRQDGYVHYGSLRPHGHVTNSYGSSGAVMIVEVANGSTVTMKPAPVAQSYFQFFYGFNGPSPNRLPTGDTGFMFRACPRHDVGPNGRVTDFYLGFSIEAGRTAPVDIWTSPSGRPIQVIFTR